MRTSWLERGGFWDREKKQPVMPVIREIPVGEIRPNPAQPRLHYEERLWQSWLRAFGKMA